MTTINIDTTIINPGVTAYDSGGGVYTKFVPGAVGAPELPTHYIQSVTDSGTATAYVTTETAPASPAKTIVASFGFEGYDTGTQTAAGVTVSDASAEITFNLSAVVGAWSISKITNHAEQARARIISQYQEVI
jgi:hypothetical protein